MAPRARSRRRALGTAPSVACAALWLAAVFAPGNRSALHVSALDQPLQHQAQQHARQYQPGHRQHPARESESRLDGRGTDSGRDALDYALLKRQSNSTGGTGGGGGGGGGGGITVSIPGQDEPSTSATTATTSSAPTTQTTPTNSQPNTASAPTTATTIPTTAATSETTTSTTLSTEVPASSTGTTSDTTVATTASGAVTTIVTVTNSNGDVLTSAVTTSDPSQQSNTSDSKDDGPGSKAWIIPLSVIGGIIVLAGFLFLGYRCTQRRFSELDDEDGNPIRWPELMQRSGGATDTLNPLATKRREGAGFDMDEGASASNLSLPANSAEAYSNNGRITPSHAEVFANAGLGAPGMAVTRSASSAGSSNVGSSSHAAGVGYYPGSQQGPYYDPYLGASGAPYPPPPRVVSPSPHDGPYYDNFQGPPSPYYPPPSRNAGPSGRSSPFQGAGAGPVRTATPPAPEMTYADAYMGSHIYGDHEEAYHPGLDPPLSPTSAAAQHQPERAASPPLQQASHRPMRLSIANPDHLT